MNKNRIKMSVSNSNHRNNATFELSKNDTTGIATICVNNPSKRNAINGQMMEQIARVIEELEDWKIVCFE
jgi:enoyl-CoA hydratase/carnithine racemase